jgi:hypothetical protein
MNNVWWNLQWLLCLCYIYDIIIFGNDIETALENLIAVFQSFRWTNLKLKSGTCSFFQTEVKFLGHVVSEVRIKCDPEKAQSVQNWHIPSNIKEIQCFLEFVPYYRRVRLFNNRTSYSIDRKEYRPFVWDQSCDEAFQCLKQLCTDVIISNRWWHLRE